jgi:hypothetical protein
MHISFNVWNTLTSHCIEILYWVLQDYQTLYDGWVRGLSATSLLEWNDMKATKFNMIAHLCSYLLTDDNAPHIQHTDKTAEFAPPDYIPPPDPPKTWKILIYQDCWSMAKLLQSVSRYVVKCRDTRVRRWSTECTRHQITRTLASTYVLRPRELLVQYFGGPEYKSRVKGVEGRVVCPTFKWARSSIKLRKGVRGWNST